MQSFYDKCQDFKHMVEVMHTQFPKILKNRAEAVTCGVLNYAAAQICPQAFVDAIAAVTGRVLNIHTTRVFIYVRTILL